MAVFHQNVILPFCFILQIPKAAVDTIINQENDACFDSRHQAQHNGFVRGVTYFPFQQALVVNKAEDPRLNFIGSIVLLVFTEERISPVLTLTTRRFTAI